MRKGMKLLVAVLVAMTVCAMSVSAFAATVTTTTSYSGDNVTVTTTVTGAAPNEEVAYMVKDSAAAELNNETIYYIDQKTADASGNVAPFSFTMAKSKITDTASATVLAGTESTAASDSSYTVDGANGGVINLTDCTVTYTVTGGGRVILAEAALGDVDASGSATALKSETISFWVIPEVGKKLATVNGEAVTLTNGVYTYAVTGDATLAFVFDADDAVATVVASGAPAIDAAAEKPTVSLTAKATGNFTEAGIKINGVEYKALGFGVDGAYTVTVIETVEEGATASITADAVVEAYIK